VKRRPSELLAIALAVVACLSFILGLRDVRLHPAVTVQSVDPAPVSDGNRAGKLRVSVTRVEGGGVPQATVQAFWENKGRFYLVAVESTDGDGVALLHDLPEGRTWLLADAPECARASSTLIVDRDARAVRLVLTPARSLDVTVRDETSAPIAQATVLVESADPLPFGALADPRGVAHFTRLSDAPWSVKASAPGFESVTHSGAHGDVTKP